MQMSKKSSLHFDGLGQTHFLEIDQQPQLKEVLENSRRLIICEKVKELIQHSHSDLQL